MIFLIEKYLTLSPFQPKSPDENLGCKGDRTQYKGAFAFYVYGRNHYGRELSYGNIRGRMFLVC